MSYINYLSIPYRHLGRDFSGCDCLGLVMLFYKNELGIELPDNQDYDERWFIKDAIKITREYRTAGFNRVITPPEYGDVLLLNSSGHPKHLGVVISPDNLLHTTVAGTACHSYRQGRLSQTIHSTYRYKKDSNLCG